MVWSQSGIRWSVSGSCGCCLCIKFILPPKHKAGHQLSSSWPYPFQKWVLSFPQFPKYLLKLEDQRFCPSYRSQAVWVSSSSQHMSSVFSKSLKKYSTCAGIILLTSEISGLEDCLVCHSNQYFGRYHVLYILLVESCWCVFIVAKWHLPIGSIYGKGFPNTFPSKWPKMQVTQTTPGAYGIPGTLYPPLHYTTVHYTTLHSTTLHYTTLHYTSLHYTDWHCTTDRQVDR